MIVEGRNVYGQLVIWVENKFTCSVCLAGCLRTKIPKSQFG